MVLRDGGPGSSGTGDGDEPQVREELLEGVEPSPDCPDAAEAPTPAAGEVVVTVVRVVDGCLAYSGEAVAGDRADARLRQLRADPEVVAADRVVARAPGGSGAPMGDDPVEQWTLAPEHLDGAKVRELWPAGAPEVRVAVIDTGIDETHLDLADQIVERAPWAHRYDGDPYTSHGTHVAGIVAAADDGAGALGLTPAARLMDVQYWDQARTARCATSATSPSGRPGSTPCWAWPTTTRTASGPRPPRPTPPSTSRRPAPGPDELWLADPISGEPIDSHTAPGNVSVADVAVDATGDRVAYLGAQSEETCDGTERVYLLDASGGALEEVAQAALPPSDLGVLQAEDIFFNGDRLYATFIANDPGANTCTDVASAGVWRLDAAAATWEQVDDAPVTAVRPVEGLTGDPETGKVTIDFDSSEGRFVPTGSDGSEQAALGETQGYLWATPTSTEVDLAREGSPPPVDTGGGPSTTDDGGGSVPNTTEAAVARYEDYLHAVGDEDIDTMCEIAGPAAASAEQQGFGDCPTTFGIMLGMISAEQKAALRAATIDVDQVSALGGRVDIPATAVADVSFTESDLGDNTLAYQDGNWFIVDEP